MEKELKLMFDQADREIPVSGRRKGEAKEALFRFEACDRCTDICGSRIQVVQNCMYYMDKRIWAAGTAADFLLAVIFTAMRYYGASADDAVGFLMPAAAFSGAVSILVLSGMFSDGMAELSDTCYFSTKQLACMEMLLLGAVNLTFLLFLIFFAGVQWELPFVQTGMYAGVPFLFSTVLCMGTLLMEKFRNKPYAVTAAGMLSSAGAFGASFVPEMYAAYAAFAWGAGAAAGGIILIFQIRLLLRKIGKGEILCTE